MPRLLVELVRHTGATLQVPQERMVCDECLRRGVDTHAERFFNPCGDVVLCETHYQDLKRRTQPLRI